MTRSRASLCIVLAFLSGCAANPHRAYQGLQDMERARVIPSLEKAIHAIPAVRLEESEKQTVKIGRSDPVIDLGSYSSFFKVLAMRATAATPYKLTVKSPCDCFGKTKTVIVPRVYVVNDQGELIVEGPQDVETRGPGLTSNLHEAGTMTFQAPSDGDYFLVVAADNSRVGAPVQSIRETWTPDYKKPEETTPVEYDIVSSPVGKVSVELKKDRAH